jgi:hypothetical protein
MKPLYKRKCTPYGHLVRTTLGSSLVSAAIAALLWIIISFATGGTALFSLGGGILCGVVVFIIGYSIRRLVLDRRKAASGRPELSAVPLGAVRGSVRLTASFVPRVEHGLIVPHAAGFLNEIVVRDARAGSVPRRRRQRGQSGRGGRSCGLRWAAIRCIAP